MRSFVAALALGVALSSGAFVQAAPTGAPAKLVAEKKAHAMKGTISSVDGETVVISATNKAGEKKDHKVKTDASTKVMVDGKDAKVSDLKAGQEVVVTPGAKHGDPASEIEATSAAK